jgi:hypothetical protein
MKKAIKTGSIAIMILMVSSCMAQSQNRNLGNSPSFKDPRDGKTYRTVEIGAQIWMAQDLDYHGEDGYLGLCFGDKPQAKKSYPEHCKKYGRLYSYEEAETACPEGWHLSTDREWQTLVNFAGGEEVAGKKLKAGSGWGKHDFAYARGLPTPAGIPTGMADRCRWTEEKIDDRGRSTVVEFNECATDEFGFGALPLGPGYNNGSYNTGGVYGYWWAASAIPSYRYMSNTHSKVERKGYKDGNKVRCVKDDPSDSDGNGNP